MTTVPSSPPIYRDVVICTTSLPAAKRKVLKATVEAFGAQMSKSFTNSTTHVVCDLQHGLARRTIKYLQGILAGKWIVSFQWIEASQKAGYWVEEGPYEVAGDVNRRDGPARGRERAKQHSPPLFHGWSFMFHGDISLPSPSWDDFQTLLTQGISLLM